MSIGRAVPPTHPHPHPPDRHHPPTRPRPPGPDQPRRILIVRPSALGDVARSVPAVVTLRHAFPDARIDWLVREGFEDVIRHHPMLDEVVPFHRWPLLKLVTSLEPLRRGRRLRQRLRGVDVEGGVGARMRYDRVYDLQGLARSGLMTRLTGARHRVGFSNARELGWLGYTARHRVEPMLHTVGRTLALLRADGLQPIADLRLYMGPNDRRWLETKLGEWAIDHADSQGRLEGDYTCIAPGAKWGCKRWPVESYALLARRLVESGLAGDAIVLVGSPSELAEANAIVQAVEAAGGRAFRPTTSVGQLMALVSGCKRLICNDSAPLHIGVGFARPLVAIFGPTDPALVGPYGRSDCVVQPPDMRGENLTRYRHHSADDSLIRRVGVDTVWERIERMLQSS